VTAEPGRTAGAGVTAAPGVAPAADFEVRLRGAIRDIPDYPSPGVLFKDITPLLANGPLFAETVAALAGTVSGAVDVVAGIEARGFIFGAPVALSLGAGFVPIRKRGKLPHTTVSAEYALEYGTASIELHTDAIRPGQRVLLLDDVLATGGTAEAAARLLEEVGAEVVAVSFLIELGFLDGRQRLPGRDVRSLVRY
jgi:adenine phosphoribosyltransferase